MSALPPIERDESMKRDYIPLPGGWEIQTKGNGSSFRLCDTKSHDRWIVWENGLTGPYGIHAALERMAREIRAAIEAPVAHVIGHPEIPVTIEKWEPTDAELLDTAAKLGHPPPPTPPGPRLIKEDAPYRPAKPPSRS